MLRSPVLSRARRASGSQGQLDHRSRNLRRGSVWAGTADRRSRGSSGSRTPAKATGGFSSKSPTPLSSTTSQVVPAPGRWVASVRVGIGAELGRQVPVDPVVGPGLVVDAVAVGGGRPDTPEPGQRGPVGQAPDEGRGRTLVRGPVDEPAAVVHGWLRSRPAAGSCPR